jgi:hypothetical protein
MTGSLCGSHCEPTGLSQYPVFKVQTAADSLHILRFCPPLTSRFVFSGKEIPYALASVVSTGFLEVLGLLFGLSAKEIRERKTPPETISGGEPTVWGALRPGSVNIDSSPCDTQFSTHAPVSRNNPRCGGVMYQSPAAYARVFLKVLSRYPDPSQTHVRTTTRRQSVGRSAACLPATPDSQLAHARTNIGEAQAQLRQS